MNSGATILHEGRVLLVRHSDAGKKDYGDWLLPAGKANPGETAAEAINREIREELGVEVTVEGVLAEHRDPYTGQHFVNYLCHSASSELSISSELSEFRWVGRRDVEDIERMHPGLRGFLLDFFDGKVKASGDVERYTAVILAAGKSSRMGRNKLLLPLGGRTVLDLLLDALKTPIISEVVVVTGNKPEEITGIIESHGARRVHNSRFEEGMTTSVQAGFLAAGGADGVFLFLGDQVGVQEELLKRMIKELDDTDALLVSPKHEGKRGHPVLFSRRLIPKVLALKPEETLKDVVLRHEAEHRYVPGDEWTTLDLDTPDDYEKALKRLA